MFIYTKPVYQRRAFFITAACVECVCTWSVGIWGKRLDCWTRANVILAYSDPDLVQKYGEMGGGRNLVNMVQLTIYLINKGVVGLLDGQLHLCVLIIWYTLLVENMREYRQILILLSIVCVIIYNVHIQLYTHIIYYIIATRNSNGRACLLY